MIWDDFLVKLKDFGGKVTKENGFTIVEFTVTGDRRHITLQIDDRKEPIDNVDVTRILNRFGINEMLFRCHL